LVEQPLTLRAASSDDWSNFNLEPAIKSVLSALNELKRDPYTLVLLDPELQRERQHIKLLADRQQHLLHPQLQDNLSQLNESDQQLLRQWLNNPSQTDVTCSAGCSAVMQELARSQQYWAQLMPEAMANVAGVLELSIALANLSPSYAVI
jgi:hypothetical protein